MLNRRTFAAASGLAAAFPALAQFRVEISGVGSTQLPIAIAKFKDEDRTTQVLSAIIRADLERAGVFRSVDAPQVLDEMAQPQMADWRTRGADALLGGSVSRLADGRFDVRFKIWDVVKGKELGGQSKVVAPGDLRLAAHNVADYVYEKLTGEKGVFSTRIAYVTRSGSRYALRVADSDGEGGQVALASPEPIISPAWAPNGQEVAYVSFESQKAVVYAQDIGSGKRRAIANFRGSNSAPAWSPDGQSMVATLRRDGVAQVFAGSAGCIGEQLSPFAGHSVRTSRLRARKLAVDVELVGLPDIESRHSSLMRAPRTAQGRGRRLRDRNPIPCSRRTVRWDRTCCTCSPRSRRRGVSTPFSGCASPSPSTRRRRVRTACCSPSRSLPRQCGT